MEKHTKLIRLDDGKGILVQVDVSPNQAQQVSGGIDKVKETVDKITPILTSVCKPLVSAWQELNKEMQVEQTEVELGISFSGEGNIYLAKTTMGANLTVKLTLKPKL